jgi:putative ABC transport system permease protein
MDEHIKRDLRLAWIVRMAWRDSRRNRHRLVLFITSVILGIAALVATFSFGNNMKIDIDRQAQTLVGADLVVETSRKPAASQEAFLDSLGTERSSEKAFASMIYFVKGQGSRLVQVRALEGNYPYYGSLETSPADAGISFRKDRKALVDKTLMLQFGATVGDSIRIGQLSFLIAGSIDKAPGRTEVSTTIAPPVYIPLKYVPATGLEQKGSRIAYYFYYKYPPTFDVEKKVDSVRQEMQKEGFEFETVETRKKETGRAFDDFLQFLGLISFIALLLGCLGVGSSIHIYIREKAASIATLRCLGATSSQAFLIYLVQVICIGLIGALLGAALGVLLQQLLPKIFRDFLPITPTLTLSWSAIGQGLALGVFISVLFGLQPLISIRNISPFFSLRRNLEQSNTPRDPLQWFVYSLIFAFVAIFSHWVMHRWSKAILFTGSVVVAFFLLGALGITVMWVTKKLISPSWTYLWRQGFANLYRPHNQTIILVITIGLGTSFISTMYFVQRLLVARVSSSAFHEQPNMVLFDIQSGQKDSVATLIRQNGLSVLQEVPIVAMRLQEINGKTIDDVVEGNRDSIPPRAFENELRVTYRDSLTGSEKIIAGKFSGVVPSADQVVPVSLEERYARRIHVWLGDSIVFNVQGRLVPAVVGSIRSVEWRRIQTNFRVIFPRGILEEAPQFYIVTTRVPSREISARLQQALVREFPTISVIDLGLVLSVLNDILDKIAFVIRFMAAFSILTGLIVLIGSVMISKYQRIQESSLLRTLGASRRQILIIFTLEYFFLGLVAAIAGIILSMGASWALAKYSFDTGFSPQWLFVIVLIASITLLTVAIGLFNSRDVLNKAPLEILRSEE